MLRKNKWLETEIRKIQNEMSKIDITDPAGCSLYTALTSRLDALYMLRNQEAEYNERKAKLMKLKQEIEEAEREENKKWYQRVDPTDVVSGVLHAAGGIIATSMVLGYESGNPISLKNAFHLASKQV